MLRLQIVVVIANILFSSLDELFISSTSIFSFVKTKISIFVWSLRVLGTSHPIVMIFSKLMSLCLSRIKLFFKQKKSKSK